MSVSFRISRDCESQVEPACASFQSPTVLNILIIEIDFPLEYFRNTQSVGMCKWARCAVTASELRMVLERSGSSFDH